MLTLDDLADRADCFLWGHQWKRSVELGAYCTVCGETRRRR